MKKYVKLIRRRLWAFVGETRVAIQWKIINVDRQKKMYKVFRISVFHFCFSFLSFHANWSFQQESSLSIQIDNSQSAERLFSPSRAGRAFCRTRTNSRLLIEYLIGLFFGLNDASDERSRTGETALLAFAYSCEYSVENRRCIPVLNPITRERTQLRFHWNWSHVKLPIYFSTARSLISPILFWTKFDFILFPPYPFHIISKLFHDFPYFYCTIYVQKLYF